MERGSKINQSLKETLKMTQQKRLDNGVIITYKDGQQYLQSPGYTTVNLASFKKYYKSL